MIHYLSFVSLGIMSSLYIHIVASDKTSFLRLNNTALHVSTPFCLLIIHQWTPGLLSPLACYEQCCLNMGVQISLWDTALSLFLGIYPGMELLGHIVVSVFPILKKFCTAFHSSWTTLQPHQQYNGPVSLHPHLNLSSVFVSDSSVRWELTVGVDSPFSDDS